MASLWYDLNDVYKWAGWQKILLERIFNQGEVDADVIEQATTSLLKETDYNPPQPEDETPAEPNTPIEAEQPTPTILRKLYDATGAGILKGNQQIPFHEQGMTIVYGRNGSGKSTYCNLLKLACGARDGTRVLPNAFVNENAVPSVKVHYQIGNNDGETHEWIHGKEVTPDLGKIRFYTRLYQQGCIENGLNKPNVGILPETISMMIAIKNACETVDAKLKKRRTELVNNLQNIVLPELPTKSSNINTYLTTIQASQDVSLSALNDAWGKLQSYIQITKKSEARYNELQLIVKDTSDKKKDLEALASTAQELSRLNNNLRNAASTISPQAIDIIKGLVTSYQTTKQNVMQSKELSVEEYPIQNTGSPLWQAFITAAGNFSIEAYPNAQYPQKVELPAHCLLCQQPLDEDARQRVIRFFNVVSNELEKSLGVIGEQIYKQREALELWAPTLETVSDFTKENYLKDILPQLSKLEENAVTVQKALLTILSMQGSIPESWPDVSSIFDEKLMDKLQGIVNQTNELVKTTAASKPEEVKQKAQAELNELQGIKDVFPYMQAYEKYINLKKELIRIEGALQRINLQGLRTKITRARKEHISQGLATSINRELEEFGLKKKTAADTSQGSIEALFKPQTTEEDEDTIKLEIKGLNTSSRLDNILSEGEQRALALACFFGELDDKNNNSDTSAIVFDDPAASFDYDKVSQITKRIAKESLKRQVVVFTHDVWFGYRLMQAAYKVSSGKTPTVHTLRHDGKDAGLVEENECPWIMQSSKDKTKTLKDALAKIQTTATDGTATSDDARRFYGMIYEAWEGLIEDTLFGRVISRFKPDISPSNLHGIQVEQDDYWEINDAMKEASYYRHLQPTEGELDLSIEKMETSLKRFDDHRVKLKNQLKANKEDKTNRPKYGEPKLPEAAAANN